jgi:hypothetical protein
MVQRKLDILNELRDGQSGPAGTGTVTKIFLTETGTNIFRRDRDEIFFLTGTKNDWSRSCLSELHIIDNTCFRSGTNFYCKYVTVV